jgi:hypothetical protein
MSLYSDQSIQNLLLLTYAGHHERPPYTEGNKISVYHVRHYDVLKLMHVKEPLDIFISHDWPVGITEYGNWQKLIQQKRHFEEEVIPSYLLAMAEPAQKSSGGLTEWGPYFLAKWRPN